MPAEGEKEVEVDAKKAKKWEIGNERGDRGRQRPGVRKVTGSWLHLPFHDGSVIHWVRETGGWVPGDRTGRKSGDGFLPPGIESRK